MDNKELIRRADNAAKEYSKQLVDGLQLSTKPTRYSREEIEKMLEVAFLKGIEFNLDNYILIQPMKTD